MLLYFLTCNNMVKQNTGLKVKNKYSMFNTSPLRYIAIVVVHHPESSSEKDLSLQLASSLDNFDRTYSFQRSS